MKALGVSLFVPNLIDMEVDCALSLCSMGALLLSTSSYAGRTLYVFSSCNVVLLPVVRELDGLCTISLGESVRVRPVLEGACRLLFSCSACAGWLIAVRSFLHCHGGRDDKYVCKLDRIITFVIQCSLSLPAWS